MDSAGRRPRAAARLPCSSVARSALLLGLLLLLRVPVTALSAAVCVPGGVRAATAAARVGLTQLHLGAVFELVGAIDYHELTDTEALLDRYVGGIPGTQGHLAHADRLRARVNHIDVGAGLAALDGGLGDEGGVVQRVEQQHDVDELLREQTLIGVEETRFELDG